MQNFENLNPITVSVYFLTVTGISMFCMNPILLCFSLFGSILFFLLRNGRKHIKSHFGFLCLFLIMAIINPLFSHNGATVLFVINDSPITLEALLYGFVAAAMILAVLYWFRSFTQVMTSDKLLYVFGKLSPKLSLILSMGLRYVPLFNRQTKKINATQTALGLYKEDNIIDRVKGGTRVFSVLLTWALEKGIITADSMAARGYGIGKRTHFSVFRLRMADVILLPMTLVLGIITCISLGTNALDITFYPKIKISALTPVSVLGLIAYGTLTMLPIILELTEKIKWNCLKSKI